MDGDGDQLSGRPPAGSCHPHVEEESQAQVVDDEEVHYPVVLPPPKRLPRRSPHDWDTLSELLDFSHSLSASATAGSSTHSRRGDALSSSGAAARMPQRPRANVRSFVSPLALSPQHPLHPLARNSLGRPPAVPQDCFDSFNIDFVDPLQEQHEWSAIEGCGAPVATQDSPSTVASFVLKLNAVNMLALSCAAATSTSRLHVVLKQCDATSPRPLHFSRLAALLVALATPAASAASCASAELKDDSSASRKCQTDTSALLGIKQLEFCREVTQDNVNHSLECKKRCFPQHSSAIHSSSRLRLLCFGMAVTLISKFVSGPPPFHLHGAQFNRYLSRILASKDVRFCPKAIVLERLHYKLQVTLARVAACETASYSLTSGRSPQHCNMRPSLQASSCHVLCLAHASAIHRVLAGWALCCSWWCDRGGQCSARAHGWTLVDPNDSINRYTRSIWRQFACFNNVVLTMRSLHRLSVPTIVFRCNLRHKLLLPRSRVGCQRTRSRLSLH
jgi:hypothetical protein